MGVSADDSGHQRQYTKHKAQGKRDAVEEVGRLAKKGYEMFQLTADTVFSDHPVTARLTYPSYAKIIDREEILRVLDQAASDNHFIARLTHRGSDALQSYHLSNEAKAALLSGDIRWIEAHVGKLDERQATWLRCRLQQEIW